MDKDFLHTLRCRAIINSTRHMQAKAEHLLNPCNYHLSDGAKKRLRWLYLLYYEHNGNVTRTANRLGLSREWLSKIKSRFERHNRDPRRMEPCSRAPHRTDNRQRIPETTEEKIIEIREQYPWGKEKISVVLQRDYGLTACPSTVNRYLRVHRLIDPKISGRNEKAYLDELARERNKGIQPTFKVKYRPPKAIKDYRPGALVEKDMKLVPKTGPTRNFDKARAKENFYYQHTEIDSFTRIRTLELVGDSDSMTATHAHQRAKKRFPFPVACMNTDNGGENEKNFSRELHGNDVFHFYSRTGTPTDNPRVERSHLTDDQEFYHRGNLYRTLVEQQKAVQEWEHTSNYVRPHQSLGYLTPMEFYQLWKENPNKAYTIVRKYQAYLNKQRKRLANARRIKRQEQIEKLMQFIDAKLTMQKVEIKPYKLELIKCELCSWT